MCIDFTSLNKTCPKDNFPLLRIDMIVDCAAGYEVMSLLDCFSGYHQIHMKEEDKANTIFITPFGTDCFVRMPEGLKNADLTFPASPKRSSKTKWATMSSLMWTTSSLPVKARRTTSLT
jgi:hypothetical protein